MLCSYAKVLVNWIYLRTWYSRWLLMLKEVRVGRGKCEEDRLGNRQRNLRNYFQQVDNVNYFSSLSCSTHTFSSWYSLFSLWHSIMISASSSFFGLLLLLFLLLSLLGCKGDGEAGDEVGESKSSSLLYTTWGERDNPGQHAALALGKLYQDPRESWHLNQGLIGSWYFFPSLTAGSALYKPPGLIRRRS